MAELGFDEAVAVVKLIQQGSEYLTPATMPGYTVTWYCDDARTWKERGGWQLWALDYSKADRGTWDALYFIARWHLRSGVPMLPELGEWIADRLEGNRKRPPKPGRNPETVRDKVIASTVQALVARGFNATQSKSDPGRASAAGGSACDAVGKAFGMTYGAVERVWTKSKPSGDRGLLQVEAYFTAYDNAKGKK